ncbi:MAG TPA: ShlB/FhaC/HecB family hemolysin secretion/activation protein [Gemmatimonadaceae bacterium]|nr:ShlB/FhaC/HecB family hemolysin secretion/activation protein [Gemmatimonadaceae bacterium]
MQAFLLVALAMQVKADVTVKRDSTDSTKKDVNIQFTLGPSGDADRRRREPKRIPVTEEHLRTAFKSPLARTLLLRARAARMAQDSALISYDASAFMRISAGLGFSKIGRDRLIFRHENATHVRWHRDVGAWVEVKGARTAIPVAPDEAKEETRSELADEDISTLPYFPGQEPLLALNGNGVVKSQVDERDIVHPIAEGAEAYYTYGVGDSITFRLPDARTINLREIRVRPRQSKWNVVVGSMWFDNSSGQLVRAAYRFSVPMDVWAVVDEEDPKAQDEIPVWVKPLISPMRAQISAVAVEYGLYQGRFWLPRIKSAEGDAQVSFMHVPFKFEQSFKFATVNAIDSLPAIQLPPAPAEPPDSLSEEQKDKWRDSVRDARFERRHAERDSVRRGLKADTSACADPNGVRTTTRRTYQGANVKVAQVVPCDLAKLENSPELPKSIYDEGEEVFGSKERDALIKEALSMGAQPPFALGAIPPSLKWGLEFTRFNRVEGLSTGALVEQQLGSGYTASLLGRLGHADLEPNVELGLARSNLVTIVRLRGYNRLVSASDWGNPLSFGSSLSALLFGRDEGFYYRSTGAELEWERNRGALITWRLFAERERTATPENSFSLGPRFIPNIVSRTGQYAGFATRLVHTKGLDPNGFRVFTDLRLESAVSDSASSVYGRGALDLTFTQGIGRVAAALTMAGGTSAGVVPAQRQWYLGGSYTVRGQRADTAQAGNAFWLGRLEVGGAVSGVRPVVFGDVGWVGDRETWRDVGRPMSGVGVGASMMDGLIRVDLARGLYPQKRLRFDAYLNAKF